MAESQTSTQSLSSTPVVLSIAGSDSCAGAGLQADLKTCAALGVYACTVVTAITAQNTQGVQASWPVSAEQLRGQLEAIDSDVELAAIKVGMLANAELVNALADWLEARCAQGRDCPLVIDPVLVSSSGRTLLDEDGRRQLIERLLPLTTLLTPNLPEAALLLGEPEASNDADIHRQGEALMALGGAAILIKGGHGQGHSEGDGDSEQCVDWLLHDGRLEKFSSERIDTQNDHGTGCTLASAIAACLAYEVPLGDAVAEAKQYLAGALYHADQLSIGGRALSHNFDKEAGRDSGRGPLHHFYRQWPSAAESDADGGVH